MGKDAVAQYLTKSGLPSKEKGYNVSGRAYPDISAQATLFMVVNPAPLPGVSGTSCASPTAAGVFSLLNDLRLQQGKSTLGFLNPFIYENAAAFNDITGGGGSGWPPKKGWDAVTGELQTTRGWLLLFKNCLLVRILPSLFDLCCARSFVS